MAADPDVPETLNNRKTVRQIFAYQPGNGLLLQSRLYNTSGGVRGAHEDSKLYRDLIQRELAELEQALLKDFKAGHKAELTDDHAIKAVYDEVTALLNKLQIPLK